MTSGAELVTFLTSSGGVALALLPTALWVLARPRAVVLLGAGRSAALNWWGDRLLGLGYYTLRAGRDSAQVRT